MEKNIMLIVEDNPDDEELTRIALMKANVKNEVTVVRDGAEALDYVFRKGVYQNRDPNEWIQVIILDLKLPKVNGIDVLREIRANEETKFIPVVVLSSSKETKDLQACYDIGANSFIHKVMDLSKYFEVMKSLSLYWLKLNECARSKRV